MMVVYVGIYFLFSILKTGNSPDLPTPRKNSSHTKAV